MSVLCRPVTVEAGFTVLELLVAVAIMAILASLVIFVVPGLRDRAKALDTSHRLQAVTSAVRQAGGGGEAGAYLVMRDGLGMDLRWGTMREVFNALTTDHRVDLANDFDRIPPRTVLYTDKRLVISTKGTVLSSAVPLTDFALDARVGFTVRMGFWSGELGYFGDRDQGGEYENRPQWAVFERNGKMCEAAWSLQGGRWTSQNHPLGESLERTREVMPTGPWDRSRYLTAWPILRPVKPPMPKDEFDPVTRDYRLTAWPASDWGQDRKDRDGKQLRQPPVWEWPWGDRILSRRSGDQLPFKLHRNLSELSPLHTIPMLQVAGIVPAGPAGAQSFREDRSHHRQWNDRWGNPIVVATAAYAVPRYDVVDDEETFHQLKGGRDHLLRRAMETYGHIRSVYLAAGSAGPRRALAPDAASPSFDWEGSAALAPWTETDDDAIARLLWQQVRAVCRATDWDEESWVKAPWSGVRDRTARGQRCLLTAPVEVK